MKKALICGMKKDRQAVLDFLQRQGVLEIHPAVEDDGVFQKTETLPQKTEGERAAALARQALDVLNQYAPEQKGLLSAFEGRQILSVDRYQEMRDQCPQTQEVVQKLLDLSKEIGEKRGSLPRLEQQREELVPWSSFDLPLDFSGTQETQAFIGSFPEALTVQGLMEALAEKTEAPVEAELVSSSQMQSCFFLLCGRKDGPAVESALKELGFQRAPASSATPARRTRELEEETQRIQEEIRQTEQAIRDLASWREPLKFLMDYYQMQAEESQALGTLAQSQNVFLLSGYVPASQAEALGNALNQRFQVCAEFSDPDPEEDVPVLLHNNKFAEPVEGIVEGYSLPGKGEPDPTSVTAPFYYILFGLMLSDAAYGLILVAACAYAMKKCPRMEAGMKRTLRMFLYCGISTIFWGLMFGSFFGDAVNVIATTFFNRPDIRLAPLWFEPVSLPMKMLVFSFALGIVHLFTGLAVKLYSLLKSGDVADSVYDVVFWYMLAGGCIVYILTMPMMTGMLELSFTLPSAVGVGAAIVAAIGLVGIILTSGRESRSWGKRLLKGIYGAYGITSYLSDILSYSRLLALGLATSVISTVFNQLGSMLGNSIPGAILFVLVFLIGHTLNLAINAMGAYVHTNRLQYVEFFGKFYDGGGRKFQPFAVHTKYYNVKEDLQS